MGFSFCGYSILFVTKNIRKENCQDHPDIATILKVHQRFSFYLTDLRLYFIRQISVNTA